MLEFQVNSKTKRLRTAQPGSAVYEKNIDYLLESLPFIMEYENERTKDTIENTNPTDEPSGVDAFVRIEAQRDTRRVYDEFLAKVEHDETAMQRVCSSSKKTWQHPCVQEDDGIRKQTTRPVPTTGIDMCDKCDGRLLINEAEGLVVCCECGVCSPYMETGFKSLTHSEQLERGNRRQFTYKRISHFCETLQSVQGKQRMTVPDNVLQDVNGEIQKYRLRLEDVTSTHIRSFLKRLGYSKYYDAVHLILNTLKGSSDTVIPRHIEDSLIKMFIKIQKPFDDVCERGRKNMLRYAFIIYKMLELIGPEAKEYLKLFPLLKSKTKLAQHDNTWKRICQEVGWEFIPTV
jgi:hypothetical protein